MLVMAMADVAFAWFRPWSRHNAGAALPNGDHGPDGHHLEYNGGTGAPRGGSSAMDEHLEHREELYEEIFQPPRINLEHMSLALRLTSEWNRRLLDGVLKRPTFLHRNDEPESESEAGNNRQQVLQQRGGSNPVNVHAYRTWHQPIAEVPEDEILMSEQDLTFFHAKSPREQKKNKKPRCGVARWGPELFPYLEHVVDLLGVSNKAHSDGVEIPLAMIYLDRACSVETPRTTSGGVPPCPFCTPRTVHRLSLVALLIATQAVHGGTIEEYYEKLQSLGIPLSQLEEMLEWMKRALGDPGLLVTVGQMKEWSHRWDCIFYPLKKQQQQQLTQQEHARLE
jgi:hypothetical protein